MSKFENTMLSIGIWVSILIVIGGVWGAFSLLNHVFFETETSREERASQELGKAFPGSTSEVKCIERSCVSLVQQKDRTYKVQLLCAPFECVIERVEPAISPY